MKQSVELESSKVLNLSIADVSSESSDKENSVINGKVSDRSLERADALRKTSPGLVRTWSTQLPFRTREQELRTSFPPHRKTLADRPTPVI